MPMYEYRCEDCGEAFEIILRFSEADQTQNCPACHSSRTSKMISIAAIGGAASGSDFSSGSSCASGGRFT